MNTLKIEINSKTGDFADSLKEVTKNIEEGFFNGFDKNDEENYTFKITP